MPLPRRALKFSLVAALLILLTARSVLLPGWASQLAPVLAAGFLLAGVLPHGRNFRLPPAVGCVALLVGIYVASTVSSGSTDYFLRALSIGLMWLAALIVGANLVSAEKLFLLGFILIVVLVELGLAVAETLLGLSGVRNSITADQAGQYIVRANTILGEWTNRAQGTIGYPIPMAHLFVVGIAVAMFSPLRLKLTWRVVISIGLVAGIALTGTRSGLAAAAAVLAFGMLSSLSRNFKAWKLAILTIIALGALSMAAALSGEEKFAADGSFTHRLGVLNSLGQIFNLPVLQIFFGSGINSHEALFEKGYFGTEGTFAVDNAFVTILIYTGFAGLLLFVISMVFALRHGGPLECAILGAFITFGLSYDFVNWHLMGFLLFLFIGTAVNPKRLEVVPLDPLTHPSQAIGRL